MLQWHTSKGCVSFFQRLSSGLLRPLVSSQREASVGELKKETFPLSTTLSPEYTFYVRTVHLLKPGPLFIFSPQFTLFLVWLCPSLKTVLFTTNSVILHQISQLTSIIMHLLFCHYMGKIVIKSTCGFKCSCFAYYFFMVCIIEGHGSVCSYADIFCTKRYLSF